MLIYKIAKNRRFRHFLSTFFALFLGQVLSDFEQNPYLIDKKSYTLQKAVTFEVVFCYFLHIQYQRLTRKVTKVTGLHNFLVERETKTRQKTTAQHTTCSMYAAQR